MTIGETKVKVDRPVKKDTEKKEEIYGALQISM
jgi:hypothetical protein